MARGKWTIAIARESTCIQKFSKSLIQKTWYVILLNAFERCVPDTNRCALSIIFVDDEKIKALNSTYRKLSRVTDVLSFSYGEGGSVDEGEIYICLPQVLRQHTRFRTTLTQEIARLFFHGLLHVYGYDHVKQSERTVMRSLERCAMNHANDAGALL